MATEQKATENATKEEDEAKRKRTNEQQQHNLKWLPFYLRRTLFLSNVVRHRRCSLWRFGAQSFSVLLRPSVCSSSALCSFDRFGVRYVCVPSSTTTTIFSVAIAVWLLSPSLFRCVSFRFIWNGKSVKGKRSPQQQPSQIKEHEILAKNGQTKQWIREINNRKKIKKKKKRKWRKKQKKSPNHFILYFVCVCVSLSKIVSVESARRP